jgi:phosphatidylserine decarboxylase
MNFQVIKDFFGKIKIHPAGTPFIIGFLFISLALYFISDFLGNLGMIITAWVVYFFRDPIRAVPQGENLLISPADGEIIVIKKSKAPAELELGDEERTKISIFLNVFDVHVNRMPVAGLVKKIKYHPGKFFSAELDKASEHNERNSFVIESESDKKEIVMVQIAGFVARRILCNAEENQTLEKASRVGIIRFGSRVDLYLPTEYEIKCWIGQRTIGGETVLADIKGKKKTVIEAKKI